MMALTPRERQNIANTLNMTIRRYRGFVDEARYLGVAKTFDKIVSRLKNRDLAKRFIKNRTEVERIIDTVINGKEASN